jgi:hypothetical protein
MEYATRIELSATHLPNDEWPWRQYMLTHLCADYCLTTPELIGQLSNLVNLVNLRFLSLMHNPLLTTLPDSMSNLTTLSCLDLRGSSVEKLPYLPALETLYHAPPHEATNGTANASPRHILLTGLHLCAATIRHIGLDHISLPLEFWAAANGPYVQLELLTLASCEIYWSRLDNAETTRTDAIISNESSCTTILQEFFNSALALRVLRMNRLPWLETLPPSLCNLKRLSILGVNGCPRLVYLPNKIYQNAGVLCRIDMFNREFRYGGETYGQLTGFYREREAYVVKSLCLSEVLLKELVDWILYLAQLLCPNVISPLTFYRSNKCDQFRFG